MLVAAASGILNISDSRSGGLFLRFVFVIVTS